MSSGDVSDIARVGSGSACRSLYGGFVRWEMGAAADGSDSRAVQLCTESHWPEMRVLVCVVSDKKKDVSSTSGMHTTMQTSTLMEHRMRNVVPARLANIEKAILNKDFGTFAALTMQDSNSFHAVCLDTYPPISYMNDVSRRIVQILSRLNDTAPNKVPRAAYTFDAGPNAVIYLLDKDVPVVLGLLDYYFPSSKPADKFIRGNDRVVPAAVSADLQVGAKGMPARESDAISYILCTRLGPGPMVLKDAADSLIDAATGLPKKK